MGLEEHKRESPASLRFAVITISDTRDASSDKGGAYLVEALTNAGHTIVRREIVRDEPFEIKEELELAVEDAGVDLVLTTGGTGIAPRDVTFDTLRALFDSEIPGFGELFRWLSFREIGSRTRNPTSYAVRDVGSSPSGRTLFGSSAAWVLPPRLCSK